MSKPVVFLSHTSRVRSPSELRPGDTMEKHRHRKRYVQTLLDHLVAEIHSRGMESWRDRDQVEPGDDFQPQIGLGLARCDAGILLVDRDALGAGVMQQEAVFLGWKRLIERDFQLIPVLLGDVSEIEFNKSSLGAAAALASRTSVMSIDGTANAKTAPGHARMIAERVAVKPIEDPVARVWVEDMEIILDQLAPVTLDRAARALGFDIDERPGLRRNRARLVAGALLGASLVEGIKVFNTVRQNLTSQSRDHFRQRVSPLWVDLPRATAVMGSTQEPGRLPAHLAFGTGSLNLAGDVIYRGMAHQAGLEVEKLVAISGEGGVDEVVDTLDLTLRARLNLSDHRPDEIAESFRQLDMAVFVLVDVHGLPPAVVSQVLARLMRLYQGFVFVIVAPMHSSAWRHWRGTRHEVTRDEETEREIQRNIAILNRSAPGEER